MITIYTNGDIEINGLTTGMAVTQKADKTILYRKECPFSGQKYEEIALPHQRYALSHDNPKSGAAGRAQFEKDLMGIVA